MVEILVGGEPPTLVWKAYPRKHGKTVEILVGGEPPTLVAAVVSVALA